MNEQNIGTVSTIVGPVLDIKFAAGKLPNLLNAIEIDNNGKKLIAEVAQHIGDDVVRCVAMSSTDGLVRGTKAIVAKALTSTTWVKFRRSSGRKQRFRISRKRCPS